MKRGMALVAAISLRSCWLVAVVFGAGWFSEVARASEIRVREVRAISVSVGDLDRMVAFYTHVLGFRVDPGDVSVRTMGRDRSQWIGVERTRVRTVALRLGQERVELCQFIRPKGRPMPADSRSTDHWFQHLALVVRDMDEAYAHLRRWNVAHVSTGPQTLPSWNTNAAGIRAFYFRDPEEHVLEVIWFPPGKGDPRWQVPGGELFRGIDHTAIVVSDTARSTAFYVGTLGLRVVGGSENWGVEQEHLNQVFGARVRITALRSPGGPGIEFLEYLSPPGGRRRPPDARIQDHLSWRIQVGADGMESAKSGSGFHAASLREPLVVDPDGHLLEVVP